MPKDKSISKVLIIGSGPIVIGQAAEFDYAGTQACRVLKEEGIDVVLVNSNPATIMTDNTFADEIYLEPLTVKTVKRIILKEKPDALLASLGGQTGLNIAMQLYKEGFLKKHNVRLIGTNADAIDKAEDRELFKQTMKEINQPVIPSDIANDVEAAVGIANALTYPVIVRPAFTMGGAGGGVAQNEAELIRIAKNGLDLSPISQVLIERYIYGWKEVEFEVMRDACDNAICICSMENFDPVGVHTGDSIVVAPALTLSDKEYRMLRDASLKIIRALGIEGGCNCQFALNPDSFEYAVIEVNPRVSRSSALASKATGYPIAKVTAKIALGYTLPEIRNDITKTTSACFEPALDYVVVKLPKWPFEKFHHSARRLGTQMKATGEVMAMAPTFAQALMKAVRGAEISLDTLNRIPTTSKDIRARLHRVNDVRLFTIFEALKTGVPPDEIHEITKVDKWFLSQLKNMADYELAIENKSLDHDSYIKGKHLGYTDAALRRLCGHDFAFSLDFSYKAVDTCAAEFAAETPYFYATCDEACESRLLPRNDKERIIVLGSGPIRIGQGIEFDYSSVHCIKTLQELNYEVIIINNNPETVSTDFDTSDRLYFEPLCEEDVMNIIKIEKPVGVVVAFGGQTAIKLTRDLHEAGINILGTSAEGIDMAENRERFDALLQSFNIKRPRGCAVYSKEEAIAAAQDLGYPVLVRPSYVIGGQNMTIAYNADEVCDYMDIILEQGNDDPILIDQYLMGTELEVDVISDGEDILIPGIMQHIERAGVHSGDSIAVYPPYSLTDKMLKKVITCSEKLALALGTKGLVNIQFLIYHSDLYVIEVNPRASRTIPYISKVTGVPMVDIAARIMVGQKLDELGYGTGLYPTPPYIAVKVPVFSFEKLSDVNTQLGPEMKSTGEVLGIGKTLEEALYKGLLAAGTKIPDPDSRKGGVLITVSKQDRFEIVGLAKKLDDLGMKIYATDGTAKEIRNLGIEVQEVKKLYEANDMLDLLENDQIDFIVYTGGKSKDCVDDFIKLNRRALQLSVACLTSLDTANVLADIMASRFNENNTELIDINHMRKIRQKLVFSKMQSSGNDYIYVDNFDGKLQCPESLAINLSNRHYGIGADGLVLIEHSKVADAKMRMFNKDGSESRSAGNSIRCVAKYLYDKGFVKKHVMSIETGSGIHTLRLYIINGRVGQVTASMGKAEFEPTLIPVNLDGDRILDRRVHIAGAEYDISCVSTGNPHCVVFVDKVDDIDIEAIGPLFEHAPIFPERVNTEFVRFVNPFTLKMRVWERGNGETLACGTGACAAVIVACEKGLCKKNEDITVKVKGGDLIVNYKDNGDVSLTGNADLIFEGTIEY